jgi:rsbT co-antagonist protein RsbR
MRTRLEGGVKHQSPLARQAGQYPTYCAEWLGHNFVDKEKLALIERQQQVIRALGTPIIEVWDRVLTLPLLGVVDSARAAEVMDSLLRQVSQKSCRYAIIDLTAVEVVDTGTAAHLLRLIQALRLLGAEGIITGIQPGVAHTMVMLGMNMDGIVTLRSLRDGLKFCMARMATAKTRSAAGDAA